MTAEAVSPARSPAEIARRILDTADQRPFLKVLLHINTMAELPSVSDANAYATVAKVRQGLARWRTPKARAVKHDLDTILTHYRVDQWS